MNKKQTAVGWLINHWGKLQKDGEKMSWQQIIDIANLALQMERTQIIDAFDDGQANHCEPIDVSNGKDYYTQTYSECTPQS